ncbi:MAG: hypothetical protein K9G41_10805 [Flavobacteriales bacterium]|nr:hypothetical protein [Flavobacteriales bacterium]
MQFPLNGAVITSMFAYQFQKEYLGVPLRVGLSAHTPRYAAVYPLQSLTHAVFQIPAFIKLTFFLFLSSPFFASAQVDTTFRNSVLRKFETIRTGEDSEKMVASAILEALLSDYYSDPTRFEVELDSVPFLGQLSSWDGVIRMLCWNLVLENGNYKYHCIMRHKPTKETVAVTVFQDNSDWGRIDRKPIRPNDWYGALYYKILANRYHGKTYYTILGWDGKDNITNRKVVDVINIQGKSVILGSSMFKSEKGLPLHRLVYEYANDVSMALNYDEKEKLIIMDHLAPEDSRFEGQFQFYAPDFSYDALKFEKGEWIFERDVFAKNRSLNNLPDDARPGDFKD